MCKHYGWEHDFYRRMGWRMFRAFLREMNADRQRVRGTPESWRGTQDDPFWPSNRR